MESGGGAERSGGGGIFLSVKRNFGQVFVWGDATTVLIFSAARPYEEKGGRGGIPGPQMRRVILFLPH